MLKPKSLQGMFITSSSLSSPSKHPMMRKVSLDVWPGTDCWYQYQVHTMYEQCIEQLVLSEAAWSLSSLYYYNSWYKIHHHTTITTITTITTVNMKYLERCLLIPFCSDVLSLLSLLFSVLNKCMDIIIIGVFRTLHISSSFKERKGFMFYIKNWS